MLLSSQDLERKLQTADVFKDCDLCPDMVVVPAGNFIMGAEKDQHKVTIKQGFAIARFSVTFKQWDECIARGACSGYLGSGDEGWGRGDRPVINVNWDDTQAYVAWLSRKTGKVYRLPSEAERKLRNPSGTATDFWWGKWIDRERSNFFGNQTVAGFGKLSSPTHGVSIRSTATSGNGSRIFPNDTKYFMTPPYRGAPVDGSALEIKANCYQRILRGGSW